MNGRSPKNKFVRRSSDEASTADAAPQPPSKAAGRADEASTPKATGTRQSFARQSFNFRTDRTLYPLSPGQETQLEDARHVLKDIYHGFLQKRLWQEMECRATEKMVDSPLEGFLTGSQQEEEVAALIVNEVNEDMEDDIGSGLNSHELAEGEATQEAADKKDHRIRRESKYVLQSDLVEAMAQAEMVRKPSGGFGARVTRGSTVSIDSIPEEEAADGTPTGPNPFKELLTAKKIRVDQVREKLVSMGTEEVALWIHVPLDYGPPLVPCSLIHAVALNNDELVAVLVEWKADVHIKYDGPTIYKGVIKPGLSLAQSVQNRMGRFVGTMLGDRLKNMEQILLVAEKKAELAAEKKAEQGPKATAKADAAEKAEQDKKKAEQERKAASTVEIKTEVGVFKHTQGHPSETYEITEHLGEGHTSSCWQGWHKETDQRCAIKDMLKSDEVWLWEEINIMRKIKHPNIIWLHETFETQMQVFMILELCSGGRLLDTLTKDEVVQTLFAKGDTAPVKRLMRQVAAPIHYLHSRSICHRDTQLDSYLVQGEEAVSHAVVKMCDFSAAKEFGPNQPAMKTKVCTPSYVAREILSKKVLNYTEKIDIWSLGVVFYIILCGSPPFYGDTDMAVLTKVKSGKWKFEPKQKWSVVPDEAKDIVKRMIVPKPEDRFSASDVVDHPWLKDT